MKLNKPAIDLLLAKKCWNVQDMAKEASVSTNTYYAGIKGNIYPKQVGKIAAALNVDVESIIVQERRGE